MKKLSYIILLFLIITACKKEKVQMNEDNFFLVGESKAVFIDLLSIIFAPDPIAIPFIIKIDHNFNFLIIDNQKNEIAKGVFKKCILINKEIKYTVHSDNDILNKYNVNANYYYYVEVECIKCKDNLYKEFIKNIKNISFEIIPVKMLNTNTGLMQIIDYKYLLTFMSVDIIYYKNKKFVKYEAYF